LCVRTRLASSDSHSAGGVGGEDGGVLFIASGRGWVSEDEGGFGGELCEVATAGRKRARRLANQAFRWAINFHRGTFRRMEDPDWQRKPASQR